MWKRKKLVRKKEKKNRNTETKKKKREKILEKEKVKWGEDSNYCTTFICIYLCILYNYFSVFCNQFVSCWKASEIYIYHKVTKWHLEYIVVHIWNLLWLLSLSIAAHYAVGKLIEFVRTLGLLWIMIFVLFNLYW